jgi:hypothetical protein
MNYDQNDCPTVFSHNPTFFLTLTDVTDTLKTKVVVGCIFEVECTVGGFLILKQIIVSSKKTKKEIPVEGALHFGLTG